jgi:hypothetical protein
VANCQTACYEKAFGFLRVVLALTRHEEVLVFLSDREETLHMDAIDRVKVAKVPAEK